MIARLRITPIDIPFRVAFRHASASRERTSSVWIEARSDTGATGYGESCPRPYVTGETLDTARDFFLRHEADLVARVSGLESLRPWIAAHEPDIDRNPAAWCAMEMAILDLLARERGETVEALLSLPPLGGAFTYTAVLGDADTAAFRTMTEQYVARGFTDFKVKLSGDPRRDGDKIEVLRAVGRDRAIRVRVDANNLWAHRAEAVAALRALEVPLFAVEEPLAPNRYEDMALVGTSLGCRMVLDESLLRASQLDELPGPAERWIVNLRLSKMGGVLRSLAVVAAARRAGIPLIIGAQVGETSLLTRAALTVAGVARDVLVAQEGAFGTLLLERDVCRPPLMFGAGGVLDVNDFPSLRTPGFGISAPAP